MNHNAYVTHDVKPTNRLQDFP